MSNQPTKAELLSQQVEHIEMKDIDVTPLVESMHKMSLTARSVARAAEIYVQMLKEKDCTIFLGLAGSMVSAGLKHIFVDMIERNMVDCIVSTGANIVDQDFFEALGFRHYLGTKLVDDHHLRELHVDRIYDTFIDEDELKECDGAIAEIAAQLEPRPYSSREFIHEMGRWLSEREQKAERSIVRSAYEAKVPIFCPAFTDSSAGLGLVQYLNEPREAYLAIDSARDFMEVSQLKLRSGTSGMLLIGGGVPKNFIQDTVIACEVMGQPTSMHKYAVQITVADERDGALSGSTLREACSWGKVDTTYEEMVYSEATLALPLIAGYAYHSRAWEGRQAQRLADRLEVQDKSLA